MPEIRSPPRTEIMARPRKELDPTSENPAERWGVHLRAILERRNWTAEDFLCRLRSAGLDVTYRAVSHWLRGDAMPVAHDLEIIGQVFGFSDYRHVLPPRLKTLR